MTPAGGSRLRAIVVEDSETDAKLLVHELRRGYETVEHVRVDTQQAMQAALKEPWDVVISDWSMPSFSALEALKCVDDAGLALPFLIVSGTIGEELAVDAMRAGAHDFMPKQNLVRLLPAIARSLSEARNQAARRRAEQALVQSEARYRILFERVPIPMWAYDINTLRFVDVNDAAVRQYGYTRDEFLSMTIREIQPRDDVHEETARPREIGAPYRHRLKSGRSIEVEIAMGDLELEGRQWRLVTAMDVTARRSAEAERHQAAEALKASEARYRSIVETTTQGVWTVDQAGNTTFMNGRLAQMLGYTVPEVLGASVFTFVDPASQAEARQNLALRQEGRRLESASELMLRRKDGTTLPAMIDAAPLRSGEQIVGALAMVTDLTERRRAERALAETEAQLRQSQKLEAIGILAGGVAHDFNNILSVILSCSEFMLGDLSPQDPMREDVQEIRSAGRRAAELTRQLLLFSRQEVAAPRRVDLNEVLMTMDKMVHRIIGEDIVWACVPAEDLGEVFVDPTHIDQVIMNLVVNARDAMPAGGRLTVQTANVVLDAAQASAQLGAKPGPYVMLAVTDTGTGMDEATQARIFEPFFTTKEQGKGTGLGLSTVFGIVRQAHGGIRVESQLGKGSTFKVYFPRDDGEAEAAPAQRAEQRLGGTETVLVVEDEDAVRKVAMTVLAREGYRVLEAPTAGEALLLCERHPDRIHLLVTDVVMPQMSGPELALRIARMRPGIKVICMSGYTDERVFRHGILEAGFAFLPKPLTPDTLLAKVREVLDGDPE